MQMELLKYYWRAETPRRVANPFVRDLIDKVIEANQPYDIFKELRQLRKQLLRTDRLVEVKDLGAGSQRQGGQFRKLSGIVRHSVSREWQCRLLYRLVHYLGAAYRLEMGTSVGLSSLYQYFPNPQSPLISLEGSPELAKIARQNFDQMEAKHLRLIEGDFAETLPLALEQLGKLDFAFIDGNHAKAPTLEYFEACLPYTHEHSVLVFDDIYWSQGMQESWTVIKRHPQVSLTVDLYWAGLVFFHKEPTKPTHYTYIPQWGKPWQWG